MHIIKIKPAFTDQRGTIWDFLTDEKIQHVGYFSSKKGSIRGKHYHKEQKQYTLIMKGKVKVIVRDLSIKDSKIEECQLEKMEMVVFPPNYYHAIEALEDSECLVLTSKSRSGSKYEDDTYRVLDIKTLE